MKIRNLPDDCLELSESSPLVRWACAAFAVLLPALMLCGAWLEGWPGWERVLGTGVGTVAAALVAAVLQDWHFLFNPRRRTLTWRRRNWFRDRRGVMPFADIRDVVVSSQLETDSESPNLRRWHYSVTLATRAGPFLLTQTSSAGKEEYEALADAVRAVLGERQGEAPKVDDLSDEVQVAKLLAAGQKLAAIALLRERQGLGLAEAKVRVEQIGKAGEH